MPITVKTSVRRLTQNEFGAIAFEVMGVVYRLQAELGRFFNERVYKQALQASLPGVEVEVPIELPWRNFMTKRFLDVLVGGGAAFEFKMVEQLANPHRAQLLNYLMLLELGHGKLVNLKPPRVEEEFVNTTLRHADRVHFQVDDSRYQTEHPTAVLFRDSLIELLKDWGTGLELALYHEAMTHVFGGEAVVERDLDVIWNGRVIARQPLRLAGPDVAFHLTALESASKDFESHAQRLLDHTQLKAYLWANVTRKQVTFTLLRNGKGQS
ncbi:MAG: GxxExxY protein [Planctomycetota bacterium]